ncbi:MAG TPA: GAF domain-containing sensor histidine kinase [Acidimicrobiia bacterium]|nr:GAF domain-containing sensor histidine kinase [Acidimicrobiia bacterium]
MLVAAPLRHDDIQHQLEALYHLAVELSGLRGVDNVLDTALRQCLTLTGSQFGFIGLVNQEGSALEIAAIHGFHPTPEFYTSHRVIPLRPSIFAIAVLENRPVRSVDARSDVRRIGQPGGHPEVRTFLGVPLRLNDKPIGMIGAANRVGPYEDGHERLLLTYAAQIAIVIRNAQLYERLADTNSELERMVEDRTSRLHQASEELARKAADLKTVLEETVDAQENERQRIARDIHDGINQLLIGAMLELTSGQRRIGLGQLEEARQSLQSAHEILRSVEAEIRRVVHDLHPPALEALGLPAAVRRLCEQFESFSGLSCRSAVQGAPARIAGQAEITLYRIVQEALHNVAAHAQAREVEVELDFTSDRLRLEVRDDGRGFDPAAARSSAGGHLGLTSMRQRAESLGGELQVDSAPGSGTAVRAVVPVTVGGR